MKEFSISLGLPAAPLTEDQELAGELLRVYNAIRNVMSALDSYTGAIAPSADVWNQLGAQIKVNGMVKVYLPAYEAINFGQTVAFLTDAGTTKVRLAQDAAYKCRGFNSGPNAAIGATVEVTLFGLFTPFSSGTLTPNTTYVQSATPGVIGTVGAQAVGFAITDQLLFFNPAL